MALHEVVPDPEASDDWFGEGSAFGSADDLATALQALAAGATPPPFVDLPAEDASPPAVTPRVRDRIGALWLRRSHRHSAPDAGDTAPNTWSVRTPGSVSLPRRQPGRTGWPLQGAVELVHVTDRVMARLREEAVSAAFRSAARALRPRG